MTVLWLKHNISSINYIDSQTLRPERSVCVEAEVPKKKKKIQRQRSRLTFHPFHIRVKPTNVYKSKSPWSNSHSSRATRRRSRACGRPGHLFRACGEHQQPGHDSSLARTHTSRLMRVIRIWGGGGGGETYLEARPPRQATPELHKRTAHLVLHGGLALLVMGVAGPAREEATARGPRRGGGVVMGSASKRHDGCWKR